MPQAMEPAESLRTVEPSIQIRYSVFSAVSFCATGRCSISLSISDGLSGAVRGSNQGYSALRNSSSPMTSMDLSRAAMCLPTHSMKSGSVS